MCTSCEFEIYWLFLKNLRFFKNMVDVILFDIDDGYLISFIFEPHHLPRCCFYTQNNSSMPEDSQN